MMNLENSALYTAYELQRHSLLPLNAFASTLNNTVGAKRHLISKTRLGRSISASCEVLERSTKYYTRPPFGIDYCQTNEGIVEVKEERPLIKPFCNLLHFKKEPNQSKEKLLIIAPMAGHYPTLLRGTVEGFLPYYDTYITEWQNARDVPFFEGPFSFHDCIDYLIEFMQYFQGKVSVLAVCQPTVPVLAAASYLSAKKDTALPQNLIVMGGPIDTRESPTQVNKFATDRSLLWFSSNLITRVPAIYSGFGRPVYPGFLQLFGFMSLNLKRHVGSQFELFKNLIRGDGDSAEKHREFYDEYMAVMDLPAEFYLQTIDMVFQKFSLPRGMLTHHGLPIHLEEIQQTRLLAIEGELDDIAGYGQTKAALKLCSGIPGDQKEFYLQKGVGHYGIFNGRKFREQIVPKVRQFIEKGASKALPQSRKKTKKKT